MFPHHQYPSISSPYVSSILLFAPLMAGLLLLFATPRAKHVPLFHRWASLSRCSAHIALFATPVASLSRPFGMLDVNHHRPKTSLSRCSSPLAFFATLVARLLLLFAVPVTKHFPLPFAKTNHQHPFRCSLLHCSLPHLWRVWLCSPELPSPPLPFPTPNDHGRLLTLFHTRPLRPACDNAPLLSMLWPCALQHTVVCRGCDTPLPAFAYTSHISAITSHSDLLQPQLDGHNQ